jgi:hypothetical protein
MDRFGSRAGAGELVLCEVLVNPFMNVRRLESRQQIQQPDRLVVEVDSAAVLGADEPLVDDGVKPR